MLTSGTHTATNASVGFAGDRNELLLVDAHGTTRLGPASKRLLGRRLVREMVERLPGGAPGQGAEHP